MKTINAGDFRHKVNIYTVAPDKDEAGFSKPKREHVLIAHAQVNFTRGYTMIVNNSDFEKAYVKFTIRRPRKEIRRNMEIDYDGKTFKIEYVNPLGVAGELLEMQAKEITK